MAPFPPQRNTLSNLFSLSLFCICKEKLHCGPKTFQASPSAPLTATATSSGSAIAPIPTSPHARALAIGGTTPAPRDLRNSRCFPVSGLVHIAVFIAGAISKGFASQSQARTTEVRRLSQRPWSFGFGFGFFGLCGCLGGG